MQRFADFEHGVISGINNVANGTHPTQAQAFLHPVGAGFEFNIANQAKREAWIKFGVGDLDLDLALDRLTRGLNLVIWLFKTPTSQSSKFAGNSQSGGVAGVVGQDADFEHRIAHVIDQRGSGNGVIVEENHTFVFLADAQFLFGTNHRVGFDAADFGAFEGGQHQAIGVTIVDGGTFFSVGDLDRLFEFTLALERVQVRRASQHDVNLFAVEQFAQGQAVGIGMRADLTDFGHDDFFLVPGDAVDFETVIVACGQGQPGEADIVNFQPGQGQQTGDFDDWNIFDINKFLQPRNG